MRTHHCHPQWGQVLGHDEGAWGMVGQRDEGVNERCSE